MNIYLSVEVKAREIEGRTLLALAAAERGHTVLMGGKEDTLRLPAQGVLRPGVIHDKSLTPGQYDNLVALKGRGHKITGQDEEHGLLNKSYEDFARSRFCDDTLAIASSVFCWGNHDEAGLRTSYPKHTVKFVATGSPRVDLWRAEFEPYYGLATSGLQIPSSSYVLLSSNFGGVLNENRFWHLVESQRQWLQNFPTRELDLYHRMSWQYELLAAFVSAVRRLAQTYVDITFVVRPHPVESLRAWSILLGEARNILVIRQGSMSPWVRNAKLLIHNGCTSALEAAVVGTPVVAFRPVPSRFEHAVPNSMGYTASSEDELMHLVGAIIADGRPRLSLEAQSHAEQLLAGRFCNLNGPLAMDRIVDEWERFDSPELRQKNDWRQLKAQFPAETLEVHMPERLAVLRSKARRVLQAALHAAKDDPINAEAATRPEPQLNDLAPSFAHKFPDLPDEELQTIVQRYQATLGRFRNVRAQRFGRRSFIFDGTDR